MQRKTGKWMQEIQIRRPKKTRRGYNKAGKVKWQARGWKKTANGGV